MEIVLFDLAQKLKEKGFKTENTDWCYLDGDLVQVKKYINISPYEYAPTISQVLKWLREEKKIHIEILIGRFGWYYEIAFDINENDGLYEFYMDYPLEHYKTYEQAALAGIQYTLDNLI